MCVMVTSTLLLRQIYGLKKVGDLDGDGRLERKYAEKGQTMVFYTLRS